MNEFVLKKLGEVLAFSQTGIKIFQKGEKALKTVLGDHFVWAVQSLNLQADRIKEISQDSVTLTKAEKTGTKLLAMAEMYIGDQWDNPAELLEWLGFFEGAAIVHWKLVLGAARKLNNPKLLDLAQEGVNLHSDLLSKVSQSIETYASSQIS